MTPVQVRVRVSLGKWQVEMDVHRVQDDVRRPVHLRRRCRVAVVTSRRASLRADDSHVSDGGTEVRRCCALVQ